MNVFFTWKTRANSGFWDTSLGVGQLYYYYIIIIPNIIYITINIIYKPGRRGRIWGLGHDAVGNNAKYIIIIIIIILYNYFIYTWKTRANSGFWDTTPLVRKGLGECTSVTMLCCWSRYLRDTHIHRHTDTQTHTHTHGHRHKDARTHGERTHARRAHFGHEALRHLRGAPAAKT